MDTKQPGMEKNLLLAFLLTGIILAVSQYYFRPAVTPADKQTKATPAPQEVSKKEAEKQVPAVAPSQPEKPPAPMPGEIHADKEETIVVENDHFRVTFSNRGATVHSWILKRFQDQTGKPLELVYQKALPKVAAPFSVVSKNQLPSDPNTGLYRVTRDGNLGLTFEYSDGRVLVKKTFALMKDSYLVDITSEVSQNGVRVPHALAWRGGFGDSSVFNPAADSHAVHYDLPNAKLTPQDVKVAKDAPVSASGQFSFAGLEDHYFAGVFLPAPGTSIETTVYADTVPNAENKDEQRVGAAVGGDGLNRFSFFVGPKDADLLRRVNPRLEQLIDWGTWFGFIAKPMFLALTWVADRVTHNYGWAIVLVTVIINMLMLPLRFSSLKSSRKMQGLQPQITAINAKIKSLPMKDPRRADLNQELMSLYSKNGVNPVGGCLPLVIQIPFLVALSTVLSVAIELRGASWLWVHDLSQPETIAIRILPVLLVVIQFLTQMVTPTPGVDPAQQKMMRFMPLVFGYMFYWASAGLALYWLTGGLVGLAQQWVINKAAPAPPSVTVIPPKKRK